jgi:Tol biopolymer transport system component
VRTPFVLLPDRRRLLYSDEANGALYVVGVSGGQPLRLSPPSLFASLNGDEGASFSPDGRRVAFSAFSGCSGQHCLDCDSDPCLVPELWVVGIDGSGLHEVAHAAVSPSWSPDGRRLAYGGDAGHNSYGVYGTTIKVVGADGGTPVTLGGGVRPQWAPRGNRIAYLCAGLGTICIDTLGGGTRVTIHNARSPLWSPDGSKLAFWSPSPASLGFGRYRTGALQVASASTGRVTRLHTFVGTENVSSELPEAWSPDGRTLVYLDSTTSYHGVKPGYNQLWRISVRAPRRPRRITHVTTVGIANVRFVGRERIAYTVTAP